MNQHNIHNQPAKFKAQGTNEVHMIIEKLEDMVLVSPEKVGTKKVYNTQPEICWDNYFNYDVIFDYAGKEKFCLSMKVRHDRLPNGVTDNYMHKDGTDTKVTSNPERYLRPIVMM